MVVEALEHHPEVKKNFINQFIEESRILSRSVKQALYSYLVVLPCKQIVAKMIEGIRTHDVVLKSRVTIIDMLENEYPFYTDPMPNILFQRDPFASIGEGVAINNMMTDARQRETLLSEYMFKYHPRFENQNIPYYMERTARWKSEGGDMLVLSKDTIAIGILCTTIAHNRFEFSS